MRGLNFHSHPILDSLYIEFKSTTEYIHSVRRVKDINRIEPYEPSMFIFSYFTFNSLYNIYWSSTLKNGCKELITNYAKSETDRFQDYINFIWDLNKHNEITLVFNQTITQVIRQYLSEKGTDSDSVDIRQWIESMMNEFILSSNDINKDEQQTRSKKEKKFEKTEIDNFTRFLIKPLDNEVLNISEIQHLVQIIYRIRCNLFHGAKDPEFFEQRHQRERFVIYAAILTAINQFFFKNIYKRLYKCAH